MVAPLVPRVPQGPTWSSHEYLKTHLLSKYFKPMYRPQGAASLALIPLYLFEMGSYALATVWRVCGFVKDFFYFLGTCFVALFSFGYLANTSHVKKTGYHLLVSGGEVGTGIIGIICPPLAVYLDEKIQSSPDATRGTFPWSDYSNWKGVIIPQANNPQGAPSGNVGIGRDGGQRYDPDTQRAIDATKNEFFDNAKYPQGAPSGNVGTGRAVDQSNDPEIQRAIDASKKQVDIDRNNKANQLIHGELRQLGERVKAVNVYFKKFNSQHNAIIDPNDLEKNIALALAVLSLDGLTLSLPEISPKHRVNYVINKETKDRLHRYRDDVKRDLLFNFIAAELTCPNSADITLFAQEDQKDLAPILNALKMTAKNIMLLNKVTAAVYEVIRN